LLYFTVGILFLGTPFRGSWKKYSDVAQQRYEVAKQIGNDCAQQLLQYLYGSSNDRPSPLDETVETFSELVAVSSIKITCYYETKSTDLSTYLAKLPEEMREQFEEDESVGLVRFQRTV
jgi:TPR repeat protein